MVWCLACFDCFKEVLVKLEDQLNTNKPSFKAVFFLPTGLSCIIDKAWKQQQLNIHKRLQHEMIRIIWKEIIFPFQVFKDIPFQFSACYIIITAFPVNINQSSLRQAWIYYAFIYTMGIWKKSGHVFINVFAFLLRMMQQFFLLIEVIHGICTLKGFSMHCIS